MNQRTHPLFRTSTPAAGAKAGAAATVTPVSARPPLPPEAWRTGVADFDEAWRIWQELKRQYAAGLGKNADGYYVTSPDSEPEASEG